jgi:hypothetical protein
LKEFWHHFGASWWGENMLMACLHRRNDSLQPPLLQYLRYD